MHAVTKYDSCHPSNPSGSKEAEKRTYRFYLIKKIRSYVVHINGYYESVYCETLLHQEFAPLQQRATKQERYFRANQNWLCHSTSCELREICTQPIEDK